MQEPIIVVIPTYREAANIAKIVTAVLALAREFRVIVVNDDVGDGTSDIVAELTEKYPDRVALISRKGKGGRGSAVLRGFERSLDYDPYLIMEMDADFSHAPEEIPRLVEAAKKYDIVIGSRYLPESKIIGWPLTRRIFSRIANLYARLILGVPVSDYTNGFRCYRRGVIQHMPFKAFDAKGFIALTETLYWAHCRKLSIGEVPTTFVNRARGISSVTLREIFDSFLWVYKIRRKKRAFGTR